jgi:hypothetical protein
MKYNLFFAVAVIIPVLFFGLIISRIIRLEKSLILVNGTMKTFKSSSGGARSSRENTFTLEEYSTVFKRSYKGWARINVKDRSDDLIGKRAAERQVNFYVPATEWLDSKNSKEPVTYFDLKFKQENRSQVLHYLDLFSYISKIKYGVRYFFLSFFTTLIFIGLSVPGFQNSKIAGAFLITIVILHLILIVF